MFESTAFIVTEGNPVTISASETFQQLVVVSMQITNESDTESSKARVHIVNQSGTRLSTPFKQPLEPEETVSISDKLFVTPNNSLKFEALVGSFSVTISHFNAGKQ